MRTKASGRGVFGSGKKADPKYRPFQGANLDVGC